VCQVEYCGAGDRQRIDARMRPEILVLGGDEGLPHHIRYGRIGYKDAPFSGKLCHQSPITGVHAAHHWRLIVPQSFYVRQVGAEAFICDIATKATDGHDQNPDAEQTPRDAARKPAECSATRLLPCWPLLFRLAILGGGRHQLLAGCEVLGHGE